MQICQLFDMAAAPWTIFGKTALNKMSPLVLASLTTFSGFIMFLSLGIYQSLSFHITSLSLLDWLTIIYYGTIGTVGAYLLWYQGMPKVPASNEGKQREQTAFHGEGAMEIEHSISPTKRSF